MLHSFIQFGCAFGHSTRGVGNVNEKTNEVDEYQMICIDSVISPSIGIFNQGNDARINSDGLLESTAAAYKQTMNYKNQCGFVNGILESKDFMLNVHGKIVEKQYKKLNERLNKMPNTYISSKKAAYLGNAVKEFLDSLI